MCTTAMSFEKCEKTLEKELVTKVPPYIRPRTYQMFNHSGDLQTPCTQDWTQCELFLSPVRFQLYFFYYEEGMTKFDKKS